MTAIRSVMSAKSPTSSPAKIKKQSTLNVTTVLEDVIFRTKTRTVNFLRNSDKTYQLIRGLLQGDPLSSSLCNIYLGHMVHDCLTDFARQDSLLVRAADDFFFATTKLNEAERFLQVSCYFPIQSCMTLTDMRLTEFMGLTEKSATTQLFI